MAKHIHTGRKGEEVAGLLLKEKGYRLICRNWRYKHLEVDFIAMDLDVLVFVEVKTRSNLDYGMPYEAVGEVKQAKLVRAADIYLRQSGYVGEIRFDIVSIHYSEKEQAYRSQVIKDAFWPG